MADILGGLVLVNGTDIWTEYGVFLVRTDVVAWRTSRRS